MNRSFVNTHRQISSNAHTSDIDPYEFISDETGESNYYRATPVLRTNAYLWYIDVEELHTKELNIINFLMILRAKRL
jgi:hypothetical protein